MTEKPPEKPRPGLAAIKQVAAEPLHPGQKLEPVPLKKVQVGKRTVTLPGTPIDWEKALAAEYKQRVEGQHSRGWETLSPGMKVGAETVSAAGKYLEWIVDIPVVGPALMQLGRLAAGVESAIGYGYQAQFDRDLRDPKVISGLLRHFGGRGYEDPDPKVRKAAAAWDAGMFWYETTGEGNPFGQFAEVIAEASLGFKRPQIFVDAIKNGVLAFINTGKPWSGPPKNEALAEYLADEFGIEWDEYLRDQQERLERGTRAFTEGTVMTAGGLPELIRIREELEQIAEEQGTRPTPDQVKGVYERYLTEYQAAAFPGQMADLIGQMTLDPLNIIPFLGIKDWIHATRAITLLGRVAPEVANAAQDIRLAAKAVKAIDVAEDATGAAIRAERMTEAANNFVRVARAIGIEDFTKAAEEVNELLAKGASADDIAKAVDRVQPLLDQLDEMRHMSWTERAVYRLSGGDPFNPMKGSIGAGKFRLPAKMNPFALSAAARADDFLNSVYHTVSMILRQAGDDVDAMARNLMFAMGGAFGNRFGHMLISPIGRHVQAVLKGMQVKLTDLLQVYHELEPQRLVANTMARAIGTDIVDFVTRAGKSKEEVAVLWKQLSEAAVTMQPTDAIMAQLFEGIRLGDFNEDVIAGFGRAFRSSPNHIVPYTPELFRAAIIQSMTEVVHESAKIQFGLKAANFLEKAAQPVKAVESLVLLGLNPVYPIRNFWNNEATMLMRGLGSNLLPRAITSKLPGPLRRFFPTLEDVMESYGVNPARMHEGFGISGTELLEDIARGTLDPEAAGVVYGRDLIRKTVWGTPSGVTGYIVNKVRSAKDLRRLAATMEKFSSQRAYTVGFLRAWKAIRNKFYTKINDYKPGMADALDLIQDGLSDIVADVVRNAHKPEDLQAILTSKNIRMNLETILRRVAQRMGVPEEDLMRLIPEELYGNVYHMVKELGPKPSATRIDEIFDYMRRVTEEHVEELFTAQLQDMVEEAMAKVNVEGQMGVSSVYGSLAARVTRRFFNHMERLDDGWDRILRITDPVLRDRAVKALMNEADVLWRRHTRYERAMRQAIVDGMAKRGIDIDQGFMKAFDNLAAENQAFFDLRRKVWGDYWEAAKAKGGGDLLTAKIEVDTKLDDAYARLITVTDENLAKMDNALLEALFETGEENPQLMGVVREWRDQSRMMRVQYMQMVLDFRKSIRGLTEEAKNLAWKQFHNEERMQFAKILAVEELGAKAMSGDRRAYELLLNKAMQDGFDPDSFFAMQNKILGGKQLNPTEQANFEYWVGRQPATERAKQLRQVYGDDWEPVVKQHMDDWKGEMGEGKHFMEPPADWSPGDKQPPPISFEDETFGAALLDAGPAGGSHNARIMTDPEGHTYVVKNYPDANQTSAEALANAIYRQIGTPVPGSRLTIRNGKLVHMGRRIDGTPLTADTITPIIQSNLRNNFIADCYMANWDVMGLEFGNIIITDNGLPYRVDTGGSFMFRAVEGEKQFGPQVIEIATMRSFQHNKNAATIFNGITEMEMKEQARVLAYALSDSFIDDAVDAARFQDQAIADKLKNILRQRRDDIAEYGGVKKDAIGKFSATQQAYSGMPQNIHEAIYAWVENDGSWKNQLKLWAQTHPEEAKAVQDLAQYWLYQHGFNDVPLYGGKLQMYRAGKHGIAKIEFRPWDSCTASEAKASSIAQGSGNPYVKFEIPTENIFTHHNAHPGFQHYKSTEQEFILNEKGFQGARVIEVNGHPPTEEEIAALKANNPFLEFGPPLNQAPQPGLDFSKIVPDEHFNSLVEDDMWGGEVGKIIDNIHDMTKEVAREPAMLIEDLPEGLKADLLGYLAHSEGDLNDARLASLRMGEAMRDSALLNYNRKYNFDNWMGIGMPFAFWWTHSMIEWALSTLDRPQYLAAFAKTRQFLLNAQGEHRGFPSRLRGRVQVELPFAPKEFGEAWVDPFSMMGLPFEQLLQPFEERGRTSTRLATRIKAKADEMLQQGEISQVEYDQAMKNLAGPVYSRIRELVIAEDQNLRYDLMDFMQLSVSPHVPLSMLWNIATGQPEQIGVLPHTRSLRNIAAMLRVDPGVYDNLWGNIRKGLGLPAFDQWEDYREDRELANMVAVNLITPEEAERAMIERSGEAYETARKRTQRVEGAQWGYGVLGLPVNFYPPGEERLREITPAFFEAMNQNDQGNPYPLRHFFESFPEYEARLALWRNPEERLQQFLVDEIYNRYYDMPDINRREVREALGEQFVDVMLDPATRSPTSASPEILGMWLRALGGETPLGISGDTLPVPLTRPDIANRLQVWYDFVDNSYPNVFEIQRKYFQLEQGAARRQYRAENPVLPAYWNDRQDFMYRNPDLAPYLEEDPDRRPKYESAAILEEMLATQPRYSWPEWEMIVTQHVANLVLDYFDGDPMPTAAKTRLDDTADALGLEGGWRAVVEQMRLSAPD